MNTNKDTPHVLEFSGQEGKRVSWMAWLFSGWLAFFAIGLSRQRRRERARARNHAPILQAKAVKTDWAEIVAVSCVIAAAIVMIITLMYALPLLLDSVVFLVTALVNEFRLQG